MSSTGASVSSQAMAAIVPKRRFRIQRDLVIGLMLGVLGFDFRSGDHASAAFLQERAADG